MHTLNEMPLRFVTVLCFPILPESASGTLQFAYFHPTILPERYEKF
jgi:hypothetical protein